MGVNKCDCGCGQKFGLQLYEYYRMRFVSEGCLREYKARLSKDVQDKIRRLQHSKSG
jgi:hypothetical protein